jgi:protein gp37
MRRPRSVSGISWCDRSWNPWQGCIKVSPGCKFCYMYRDKARYGQDPAVVVRSKTTFDAPLKWKAPQLVFSCSWSDFFLEEADAWRNEAWEIIRRTPQHTYLLLTKRPERIADHLPQDWPWPHVWLGVSVETQAYRWRADRLREIPAAHRFLSCEPLLEDLGAIDVSHIDWVITGGVSVRTRRPMEIAWIESLRDRCLTSNVQLFVKQDTAFMDGQQGRFSDELWAHDWTPM